MMSEGNALFYHCLTLCSVARLAGNTILERNGVIRGIVNMGVMQLPQRMKSFKASYIEGHYFLLRFYSGPYVIRDIKRVLKMDPRLIRYNVVKLGSKYCPLRETLIRVG